VTVSIVQSDCVAFLDGLEPDSVDLVLGSPPYCDARTYGINAVYDCQQWVDWMLKVTQVAVRVSRGLVLWVASGVQRELCYWPACEGLQWEWWKRGNQLWRPCVWWKVDANEGGSAIPGSGGKQWLRNDWEYVMAFKKEGWLPWADPLVMGHDPVIDHLGGEMSNRTADGQRINARVGGREARQQRWEGSTRDANGELQAGSKDGAREKALADPWKTASRGGSGCGGRQKNGKKRAGTKKCSSRREDGTRKENAEMVLMDAPAGTNGDGTRKENTPRPLPKIANPGNVIPVGFDEGDPFWLTVKARVGGGHMGSKLCHDNEAPFPEDLAKFFVLSFCPPGGLCCDPFSGSGTTAAVCKEHGRNFTGCDLRQSQVELSLKRVATVTPNLFV
jgi:hypothetical protein